MTTKKLKGIPMETKKEQELCVKEYLEHLRKHPMPEIMDAECVAALSAIEGQYGAAGAFVRKGLSVQSCNSFVCSCRFVFPCRR